MLQTDIRQIKSGTDKTLHKRSMKLMGNIFEISVLTSDPVFANISIEAAVQEIRRIEKLLTTFSNSSQTALINENAGVAPVKVDKEVFDLIERSIRISELTQGAFDITYGSLDKRFWNFDLTMTSLPEKSLAKQSVDLINYKNVVLDKKNLTVFLKYKGMRIGFGGIGKGYAAEKAKEVLLNRGVESGIVNASGDLTVWGYQENGKPYTIGIADPSCKNHPFSFMDITNLSVATSGNYEKFVIIGNKKYSHTIDPKTGYPVSGIKSVTIVCSNAEFADAMATPVMVMGIKAGLYMVNQIKGLACIIIDDNNRIYTSDNVKYQANDRY